MFFQIYAIVIMIAFYGVYFFKKFRQRRKNIQTDLLGKGKTGLVKNVEIALKVTSFLLPIAELISIYLNKNYLPVWIRIFGTVLGTAGVILFLLSIYHMQDNWRAGVPEKKETELVTNGIYKFSRNPAFLGFDLIYLGILCMFFNVPLLVITILTVLLFHLQIVNVEEPFMQEVFGEEYQSYQEKVYRYVGRKG